MSTQEPILLTAEKIPDEIYWQRCCQDLLTSYDSSRHGGSYKRLFLEKHLQSCIEKFVPQQTDLFDIKDLLQVMEPYIKRLEVTELLPPTLILVCKKRKFKSGLNGFLLLSIVIGPFFVDGPK